MLSRRAKLLCGHSHYQHTSGNGFEMLRLVLRHVQHLFGDVSCRFSCDVCRNWPNTASQMILSHLANSDTYQIPSLLKENKSVAATNCLIAGILYFVFFGVSVGCCYYSRKSDADMEFRPSMIRFGDEDE